jgi:type II pantothenate kinase
VYPLLLVNIGSGVSIIRIDSPDIFRRVAGSPLGGGTALGLGKVLLGCQSFEELIELSVNGYPSKVDLSVADLMGPFSQNSFSPDTLAASLGKVAGDRPRQDLAQSIIRMVSYNIGYIAYLVARIQSLDHIYFSGKFVHKHAPTMEAISYAVEFYGRNWSDLSNMEARFLLHEGFLGSIGALVNS